MAEIEHVQVPQTMLERAAHVLDACSRYPYGLTLSELVSVTGLPRSSAHRLVTRLRNLGFLDQTNRRYQLGFKLFEYGSMTRQRVVLREAALPFLEDLYMASRATVHLGILDGSDVVYVEKISGHSPVASPSQVGGRMPASVTALGKAMLAFSGEEVIAGVAANLTRLTPYSITIPEAFHRELEEVRRRGIAFDREEARLGLRCIAAPVLTPQGMPVAAVSLSGGSGVNLDAFASAIRLAALHIQKRMGEFFWVDAPPAAGPALPASPTTTSPDPIKVGLITTLSGFGSYLGRDIRDGFLLALEGLGPSPIDVTIEDDERNPARAAAIASRLVDQGQTQVVTGIVFSDVALAAVPKVVDNDVLYLSPNAGPALLANRLWNENFFAVAWHNEGLAESMGAYLDSEAIDNVFVVAPDYQAGRDFVTGLKRFYGGRVVAEAYSEVGHTEFEAVLDGVRTTGPSAVLSCYPAAMGIAFLKQYEERHLTNSIPLYAIAASADELLINAVGPSSIGLLNTSHWSPDLNNEANRRFVNAFARRYKRHPTSYAAQSYDTARLIAAAAGEVGSGAATADLRGAVRLANFRSVRGAFRFGPTQFPIQDWYLREVVQAGDGNLTNRIVRKVLRDHGVPSR